MGIPSVEEVKTKLSIIEFKKVDNQDLASLASDDILNLSDLFEEILLSFQFELELIEAGGITVSERARWTALKRTESRLMRLITKLDAIAFNTLIQVDLAQFNKEIIDSTNKLNQAAEKLNNIKTTINQFVTIVDFVVRNVTSMATGGAFNISGLVTNIGELLSSLEIEI